MEQPDANGFVNINWPSKIIPHGGIFHTKIIEPSTARQQYLKVLLDESKLSIIQRDKNGYVLRQEEKKIHKERPKEPLVRPRTSRRRSLSAIRESGVFDLDQYRPLKRGEDRDKLKETLAHKMAYGDKEQPVRPLQSTKPELKLPTKKEQWHDLITQIRERAVWLAEMEDLGQAGPHRELVKDQIAERMRALDMLGIDSQCLSARSSASGFSAVPSERSARSQKSSNANKSVQDAASQRKPKKFENIWKKEENVSAYEKLSPLPFSPRRRV